MSNNTVKIIFLGTNGWYDTSTGNTTCVFVETKDYYIIFDAGNGFYKIDRYIKDPKKPIYLFLSHFHLDHIIGLHILNKFKFSQGIKIYGQPGTKKILDKIIAVPYTAPLETLPYKVEIKELAEGIHKIPFPVTCRFLIHASPCFGHRIEIDGKIISYCVDTGVCKNLKKLARNADLLIAECSLKPGERFENWPHLNPEEAAKIGEEAGAKNLILIHFAADKYLDLKSRVKAQQEARKIFKNTIAAFDDMEIKI